LGYFHPDSTKLACSQYVVALHKIKIKVLEWERERRKVAYHDIHSIKFDLEASYGLVQLGQGTQDVQDTCRSLGARIFSLLLEQQKA
jgi:hypothetical protein